MKTLLVIGALLAGSGVWHSLTEDRSEVVTGEGVYIAEGCIHCHSQFSRPESLDTEVYGPATLPDSELGGAVLIGNRRQGPDLSSIGVRRSRQWNREHLIDPILVSPGSRMPSYRHLFEDGDERGEALLDYLGSLGESGSQEWFEQVSGWGEGLPSGDGERGGQLFLQLCQQCHGAAGEGDGLLAERFDLRPTDFAGGGFRFAPAVLPAALREQQLARIVKYGIAGTAMPGHEYLTDEQIADLVAFVAGFSVRLESQE